MLLAISKNNFRSFHFGALALALFLSLSALLSTTSLWAMRAIPTLTGPVIDEVGLLTDSGNAQLQSALSQFHQSHKAQIQVLIIDSLDGDPLEEYSIRVTDQWKLGDKKRDDGVLFLIVSKDRQMRLEVGQGLEGTITDLEAGRIIQAAIAEFKQGNFEQGIFTGVKLIADKIILAEGSDANSIGDLQNLESQNAPPKKGVRHFSSMINSFFLLIFIIFYLFFMVFGRRGRGGYYGGGNDGGGGWGGGGGSWGGGGGGFSGGGASGKW